MMLVDLVKTMEEVYSFVEASDAFQSKVQLLETTIEKTLKQTVECAIFIREYTGHGFGGRLARQTLSNTGQKIKDFLKALVALKQSLDSSNIIQSVFVSTRVLRGVERIGTKFFDCPTRRCIDKSSYNTENFERLKLLDPIKMDASSRPVCLHGTRQDALTFIIGWLTTPSDGKNVLWLHGLAGSGKSTLSTTVAEYFRELGRLGAFIFFDRNNPTHSDPNTVIRTLAHQLASFDAHVLSAVCAEIESDKRIAEAPMRRQFTKLLFGPLESVGTRPMEGPVIIVIDALDECGDPTSRKNLLMLLAQEIAKIPTMFRFLITSRAEFDINSALATRTNIVQYELSIKAESNVNDISFFLRNEVATIRDRHDTFGLVSDWPGEAIIGELASRSAGLFIWASLAANFIAESYDPEEGIEVLLGVGPYGTAEAALDSLYATALHTAGKWDSDAFITDFRSVMGAVVAGRISLSDDIIDSILLEGCRSSKVLLSRLKCLLVWSPGKPVHVLHVSFADYLTDPHRCGTKPWFIDLSLANDTLLLGCLRLMRAGLRFNLCGLETSYLSNKDVTGLSHRIKTAIPAHLAYACRFWADHLQAASRSDQLVAELENFVVNHWLYWLEALSLIDSVAIASPALLKTARWVKVGSTIYVHTSGTLTILASVQQCSTEPGCACNRSQQICHQFQGYHIVQHPPYLLIIVAFFAAEVNNFETITASISQHSHRPDWLANKLACTVE